MPDTEHTVPTHLGLPPLIAGLVSRASLYRERRRRGQKELGRLKRSDAVLYSPGNSGRTWLRVMLTRVIEGCYGLSSPPLVSFDNLRKLDANIPAIAVTHNRWLPYYSKPRPGSECKSYYPHRVLMLVRNPLDTCVSQYFQWRYRSKEQNVRLKGWPPCTSGLSLTAFLQHPQTGVQRLCTELDMWLREANRFEGVCVLRYEDMLQDPGAGLGKAVKFLRLPATQQIMAEAVEYGSFTNMKQREANRADANVSIDVGVSPAPLTNAHKARVGKAGGYVDYLTPQECTYFQNLVAASLPIELGYAQLPDIQPLSV